MSELSRRAECFNSNTRYLICSALLSSNIARYLVGGDFLGVYRILLVLSGLTAILLGARRRRNMCRRPITPLAIGEQSDVRA